MISTAVCKNLHACVVDVEQCYSNIVPDQKNYFTYQVLCWSPIPWPVLAAVKPADGDPPQADSTH